MRLEKPMEAAKKDAMEFRSAGTATSIAAQYGPKGWAYWTLRSGKRPFARQYENVGPATAHLPAGCLAACERLEP